MTGDFTAFKTAVEKQLTTEQATWMPADFLRECFDSGWDVDDTVSAILAAYRDHIFDEE